MNYQNRTHLTLILSRQVCKITKHPKYQKSIEPLLTNQFHFLNIYVNSNTSPLRKQNSTQKPLASTDVCQALHGVPSLPEVNGMKLIKETLQCCNET